MNWPAVVFVLSLLMLVDMLRTHRRLCKAAKR